MNIEIANRLVNLRKEKGLSQEQLAEKIGVSRQAVSKWERSEASPDTDNIILLARLYNISLDELLRTEDEIPVPDEQAENTASEEGEASLSEDVIPAEDAPPAEESGEPFPLPEESNVISEIQPEEVSCEMSAETTETAESRLEEKKEDLPPKKSLGSMINEWWKGLNLHIGFDGIYTTDGMSDEEYRKWHSDRSKFAVGAVSVTVILMLAYIAMVPYDWAYTLSLMFLLPFIACSLEGAIKSRNPARFAYPLLILEIFLFIMSMGYEQMSLLLWLTVPIYYWICRLVRKQALGTYFFPCLVIVIYIAAGIMADLWIYGLIVFAAIPLYSFIRSNFKLK